MLRLRELCVKLMFLHPVDYGRKAEELLWRKVYYEVIQVIKTNKKVKCFSCAMATCAFAFFYYCGIGMMVNLPLYWGDVPDLLMMITFAI